MVTDADDDDAGRHSTGATYRQQPVTPGLKMEDLQSDGEQSAAER